MTVRRREVMFDTNALGRLASIGIGQDEFEAVLARRNATVLHGPSTAQSLFGDLDAVRRQFLRLDELGFARFHTAITGRLVLSREWESSHPGTIVMNMSTVPQVFECARDPVAFSRAVMAERPRLRSLMHSFSPEAREKMKGWWDSLPKEQRRKIRRDTGADDIHPELVGPGIGLPHTILELFPGPLVAAAVRHVNADVEARDSARESA